MDTSMKRKSVKELEQFLRDRGVSVAGQRKAGLEELCAAAIRLGIEVDPDGHIEDRGEVISGKLFFEGKELVNPDLLDTFNDDISVLPRISIFD
jgi:hypothetical protein